jgi:PhnB protein
MKPTLLPYLLFMGKTGEAMKFYQSVLGGELKMQTFAESGMPTTEETKNNVIHAELKTEYFTFMASDGDAQHPVHVGDNIAMSIVGTDEKLLTEWFAKLSEGGKVDMPLQKQFWGDIYGQLTDKFGIHWMVNIGTAGMTEEK